MPALIPPQKPAHGIGRIVRAWRNSATGVRLAIANEAPIREELAALFILTPVAVMLPVSALEKLVLVLSLMLILLVEFLNTAIEATVDRISLERHPLAGQAKDLGSAAVALAVLMAVVSWGVIAGPLVVEWMRP